MDWTTLQRTAAAQIAHERDRQRGSTVILTHHYQRPEVVAAGDFRGDSYGLSRWAAERSEARRIVFCGVHFMAESARILARPDQRVFHPDPRAGCPMADMADVADVTRAMDLIREASGREPVVVAYMNTTAEVKAICGRSGGSVCTSSNAGKVLAWAMGFGRPVLFVPDEFLGRNTVSGGGIDPDPPLFDPTEVDGGCDPERLARGRVVLWKGYCHVHTHFTPAMIEARRAELAGCRVVVHPECAPEVVAAADATGSTEFIVRYVKDAGPGACVVIGTEVNLVTRLAREHPDRKVVPLARSLCPNMYRITLVKLAEVVSSWPSEREVLVPEAVVDDARVALRNMLAIAG